MDIINGYEQGLNIRHLVERKINDVEQSRMYAVEAHDAKMKNMSDWLLNTSALLETESKIIIFLPENT